MKKPIVTWGVFDGVHRGHQKLLRTVVNWAKAVRGTPTVLTFYEHPDKILRNDQPLMITSLDYRFALLEEFGIKEIVAFPFSRRLRHLSPEEFVRDILVSWLGAYGLVVNINTRFGKGQAGDFVLLKQLGRKYGLKLKGISPLIYRGQVISSTRIRQAIQSGDFSTARVMLGRPVTLVGTVVRGSGRGHKIGIPTANLDLHHQLIPPPGVYVTNACLNNRTYHALTSIGTRPTFTEDKNPSVEVHIPHLKGRRNFYGRTMEAILLKRLRGERKFPDAASLLAQIERDKAALIAYMGAEP